MIERVVSRIHKANLSVLFSTDIIGFAGDPQNIIPYLNLVCSGLDLEYGLEFVAFNHLINSAFTNSALAEKVIGFHGRVGHPPKTSTRPTFDKFKVEFANYNIPDTVILLNRAASLLKPVYVNVHNLELFPTNANTQVTSGQAVLGVENDTEPRSLEQTIQLSLGLNTGRFFDIVHAVISNLGSDWNRWKEIPKLIEMFKPHFVHIPMGTEASDSIPSQMPDEFWQSIARAMLHTQAFPVVECQWGTLNGSLGCNPAKDKSKILHLKKAVSLLIKHKLINN